MSQENRRHPIATKRVVLEIPGADAVVVRQDVPYALIAGVGLTMDIYYPTGLASHERTPAVLFVTGYSDEGMRKVVGCNAKDMASYISWAQLVAISGLVAITYTTRRPATDVRDVLGFVRQHAGALGIDEKRIGIWSCSGNVPNALSICMDADPSVRCAALCYGYMLDLDRSTSVADAAATFRFVNTCAGKSVADLSSNLPLFIARAGRDEMPHLNDTLDRFVAKALERNLPVTMVNHHTGPHAFDVVDGSQVSRELVRQILAFLQVHLKKSV